MDDKRVVRLDRQFRKIERSIPRWASRPIYALRQPRAVFVRIPLGILLVIGGLLSFLPVLGIWMLPLGLFFLAVDVPLLRTPVALSSILLQRRVTLLRRRSRDAKLRRAAERGGA